MIFRLLPACSAGTLLLASATTAVPGVELIAEHGLAIALVVFFVARDWFREKNQNTSLEKRDLRIEKLEDEVRMMLTTVIKEANELQKDSNTAIRENSQLLRELVLHFQKASLPQHPTAA